MGKIVPFRNTTKNTIHVGNKAVRPNTTREVDEDLIPGHVPAVVKSIEPENNPLLELLDLNIKQITAAIIGLSDEDLDALEQAETDGKTRKGVLAAIAEDRLRRASLTQDDDAENEDPEMDAFVMSLLEMSDEDLALELETCPETDQASRAAIEEEIASRAETTGEGDGQQTAD